MKRDYRETIDVTHPMGAARLVRREAYVWPGVYELALVSTDGELLCHKCVAENFAHISWEHRNKTDGGWRPLGYAVLYEPVGECCAHCGELFGEEEELDMNATTDQGESE